MVDVLSDVLRAVRLTGAVYFDFDLSAPWVAEAPPSRELTPIVMPGAQRLIEYHVIASGACWGQAIGGEPLRLEEGDILVFPQGDAHVMGSAPGMRARVEMADYVRHEKLPLVQQLGGGGEERARVICGFLGCDERPYNPLLAALPPVIHLQRTTLASPGHLNMLLAMALEESRAGRPGGENVLARLAELMFVEVVRQYGEHLPASQGGWLRALRDPVVGEALVALHADPAQAWTVEGLARVAGASRSVFAERFTAAVGHAPMQYLALWRMQLASSLLSDGRTVAEVASRVGYDSDAAFSRTFKRLVGCSPGSWRRPTVPS